MSEWPYSKSPSKIMNEGCGAEASYQTTTYGKGKIYLEGWFEFDELKELIETREKSAKALSKAMRESS